MPSATRTNAPKGTSFVIARTPLAVELLASGDGLSLIEPIDPSVVMRSQSAVIRDKRAGMRYRATLDSNGPWRVPEKRVFFTTPPSPTERLRWRAAYRISSASPGLWTTGWNRGSVGAALSLWQLAYSASGLPSRLDLRMRRVANRLLRMLGRSK
jgi:hypothetical protein